MTLRLYVTLHGQSRQWRAGAGNDAVRAIVGMVPVTSHSASIAAKAMAGRCPDSPARQGRALLRWFEPG